MLLQIQLEGGVKFLNREKMNLYRGLLSKNQSCVQKPFSQDG